MKFVLYCVQGWISEFQVPGTNSERGFYILHLLYRNFIRYKRVKLFKMSGKLLLYESPFQIVNCLKSFDLNCSLSAH